MNIDNGAYSMPASYYEIPKLSHVLPIMVYLTDEEWNEFRNYFDNVLSFTCERHLMNSEHELTYSLAETTNFGDAMRWLLKLKGPKEW